MKRFFTFILLVLMFCGGCRSRRETQRVARSDMRLEAVLEARHLDSVSLSDNFFKYVNIEFFPPDSARHTTQTGEGEAVPLGALRRVTVTTGQSSTVTHVVADTASARTEIVESDFKSVEAVSKENNTLPLMVAIVALSVAVCFLISYRRHK